MKNTVKEVTTAFSVDSINDIASALSDALANFGENEHLIECSAKLGFINQDGSETIRVIVRSFIGDKDIMRPHRC